MDIANWPTEPAPIMAMVLRMALARMVTAIYVIDKRLSNKSTDQQTQHTNKQTNKRNQSTKQ